MSDPSHPFEHWKSDLTVLNQYFESVVANYKIYDGKKTPNTIYRSHGLYRQAVHGDCNIPMPKHMMSKEGMKWKYWNSFRGMSTDTAKRRFISFLGEVDPAIIDVVPCEEPPLGFPKTPDGQPICAKCNTRAGCHRVLYDARKFNLRQQLFETPEFATNTVMLKDWAANAMQSQRCIWGLHQPVAEYQVKGFDVWFSRVENKGYLPYVTESIFDLIRSLVYYHHQLAYDMMCNKDEYDEEEYNTQAMKTFSILQTYEEISGEDFLFELPCTNDTAPCNLRRKADKGVNHMHEVAINLPTKVDLNVYADAIHLKNKCLDYGIDPSTGVVGNIEERCVLLQRKIDEHIMKVERVAQCKARLIARPTVHRQQRSLIKIVQKSLSSDHIRRACEAGNVQRLLTVLRTGGDPNQETAHGVTPLLCLVLNGASIEQFIAMAALKADFTARNKFDMSALSLACVLSDSKLVHCLMKNGARITDVDSNKHTALHWCASVGFEDGIALAVSYLLENGGVTKTFINMQDKYGDTALMLAVKRRNGLICKVLCSLGADFLLRNNEGKSASMLARERGSTEIADWMDKRMGAGVVKLESAQDVQFERMVRFGAMQVKDLIQALGRGYAEAVEVSVKSMWLQSSADCRRDTTHRKEMALQEQVLYVNNRKRLLTGSNGDLARLRGLLEDVLRVIEQGTCYPSVCVSIGHMHLTPLLCAVLLSDSRSARLLIKEGALVDSPNVQGTTAIMLASWLHSVDMLVELLQLKGDADYRDYEGYSAFEYASLLPHDEEYEENLLAASVKGDRQAVKLYSTSDVFVLLKSCSVSELSDKIKENSLLYIKSKEDKSSQIRMLEMNGLTPVDGPSFDLKKELRNIDRRMGTSASKLPNDHGKSRDDSLVCISSLSSSVHRCFLCTLFVPCKHFPTIELYLKKAGLVSSEESSDMSQALVLVVPPKKVQSDFLIELNEVNKVFVKPNQVILHETGLDDRHTNRNLHLLNEYRDRLHKSMKTPLAPATSKLLVKKNRPMSPKDDKIEGHVLSAFDHALRPAPDGTGSAPDSIRSVILSKVLPHSGESNSTLSDKSPSPPRAAPSVIGSPVKSALKSPDSTIKKQLKVHFSENKAIEPAAPVVAAPMRDKVSSLFEKIRLLTTDEFSLSVLASWLQEYSSSEGTCGMGTEVDLDIDGVNITLDQILDNASGGSPVNSDIQRYSSHQTSLPPINNKDK